MPTGGVGQSAQNAVLATRAASSKVRSPTISAGRSFGLTGGRVAPRSRGDRALCHGPANGCACCFVAVHKDPDNGREG